MKFSMNKTMIMDKIIHDGIEVDNSISIVDLINGCNDRYVEYNEILNYISEQIDIDFNIKSINFNYRTKYLGGCLFEVVLKEDDINKSVSFNVFYKDGEVSYYPGYIDMRLSSDELVELKDKFFNNSGYMDLFKIVGEFIQTFCCTYKSSSVCNEYKIEFNMDKIIVSLNKDKLLDSNKFLNIIYLYDQDDFDDYFGESVLELGNYIYKYRNYSYPRVKKYRIVNTDMGKFYIDTNIKGIDKMLGNNLNSIIFSNGEINGLIRLLNNIYINKSNLPDHILECGNIKKKVRK